MEHRVVHGHHWDAYWSWMIQRTEEMESVEMGNEGV